MARYVAFLRGVMPTNAKMPALRKAFESAGFADVATVLGSGNVVFTARAATESALERKAEAERQIVIAALDRNEWHITQTAAELGLADHASLLKIMRRHRISREN